MAFELDDLTGAGQAGNSSKVREILGDLFAAGRGLEVLSKLEELRGGSDKHIAEFLLDHIDVSSDDEGNRVVGIKGEF